MTLHHRCYSPSVAALLLAVSVGLADAAEPFEAFLETHCIRCHGPEKEKGDLRIDRLSRDFKLGADTHHWAEMMEQVNSGEMPPKKEKRPTQDEMAAFVTSLDSRIKEGRAARKAARPAVAHYRLSRREYQNTVYDLLGVRYDPAKPGELNEDTLWHGFERIGSELSLSPSHVDRYYRAAELVLDRAFPAASSEARKVRKTAAEMRYGGGKEQQAALDRFGIKRPLRYLLFPGSNQLSTFDLRGPFRQPGDIRPAEDRQYQFLEAVLAAQQKLYLVHNNLDVQKDQPLLPAVPLQQLQRYLGQNVARGEFQAVAMPLHSTDERHRKAFDMLCYHSPLSPLATRSTDSPTPRR